MSGGRRRFERFVARRYLRGTGRRMSVVGGFRAVGRFLRRPWRPLAGAGTVDEKDSRLVAFISSLAVGGVAVGVMALIVVIGVLNGLQEKPEGPDPQRRSARARDGTRQRLPDGRLGNGPRHGSEG